MARTRLIAYGWGVLEEHFLEIYDYVVRHVFIRQDTAPTYRPLEAEYDISDDGYWSIKIDRVLVGIWYAPPSYAIGYWREPWWPKTRHYPDVEIKPKIADFSCFPLHYVV